MKLRDYQEICKAKIESANWRKGSHKQLAVMPTGAGKTVLFAALASEFTRKNQGVLVVAHREELIIQAAEKLAAATGIIPGIIKAGYKPNVDAPIQVGSIQTLARRQKYPEANLIIIDEAHHAASMRAVAESMGESLFVLDDAGKLTFVNPAGSGLLGWSEAELAGRDMHEVAHVQLGGASQHLRDACPIIAPRAAGQVSRVDDDVFTRRDGSVVPVAYTAAPFITSAGAGGTVVVVRDISRQKAKELRLRDGLRHLSWAERIAEGLDQERFVLDAQPIVDLATAKTAAHELLIRMRAPGAGSSRLASFSRLRRRSA